MSSDWLISSIKVKRLIGRSDTPSGSIAHYDFTQYFTAAFRSLLTPRCFTDLMFSASSLSAPLQVQRPAGQLWHVSAGGQEVPVRLVRQRGPVHHEAALPPHLPLR